MRERLESEHGRNCPCCGDPMVPGGSMTRGHVWPRGHALRSTAAWVWVCRNCNMNQGQRALDDWLAALREAGDPRAARVERLLDTIAMPDLRHVLGP